MTARHRDPPPTWRQYLDEVFADETLPLHYRRFSALRYYGYAPTPGMDYNPLVFMMRWDWVVAGRVAPEPVEIPLGALPDPFGPPPPPRPARAVPELARIAQDSQNVHTRPVTQQTNDSTDKLLAIPIPDTQNTERQITLAWLSCHYPTSHHQYLRVAVDVNKWFTTKTCRIENDLLYRRLLRGLVAHIEKQPELIRKELYKRLWEECLESLNMCCEGHISRLCNVLVGFDESFKPPVSLGEILQDKMAMIARMDIPDDMKRTHARAIMEELGVPEPDRAAWLDAF